MHLHISVTLLLVAHLFCKGAFETQARLQKETAENKKKKEPHKITYQKSVVTGLSYKATKESSDRKRATLKKINRNKRVRERRSFIETRQLPVTLLAEDLRVSNPCTVHYCMNDTLVNCAGISLEKVSPMWFPRNTKAINLDNNAIQEINNGTFSHLTELRVLSLSNNLIDYIQENAFMGLDNLETLNLEYNRLKESAYPDGIFDPLIRLKELRLGNNKESLHLPGNLLRKLKNLRVLTVAAAGETFSFGEELNNLSTLVLSGDIVRIDHKSFENVPNISELTITDTYSLSNLTDTALQPLQQLDFLRVSDLSIGLRQSLHALKPLVGRNVTTMQFHHLSLNSHEGYSTLNNNEGIMDSDMTKYLKNICVRYCFFTSCNIYVIKEDAFSRPVWSRCLRVLDLSENPILGTKPTVFSVLNFKHIEMLLLGRVRRRCYGVDSFNDEQFKPQSSLSRTVQPSSMYENTWCEARNDNTVKAENVQQEISYLEHLISDNNMLLRPYSTSKGRCSRVTSDKMNALGNLTVYISNSLKYLKATQTIKSSVGVRNIQFVGAISLVYLDLRDSILFDFQANIDGLDALETLLLSGNDASVLSETFFDGMCHLEELDLSNCHLDANFMSNHSARVFYNLHDLRRLDMSLNLLSSLNPGTFAFSNKLELLDLSTNRFKNIPFNLRNTPKLKILDLRENSITTLEPHETNALDNLANQPEGLKFFIAGNVLSCGCESIGFLHWMQTTSVHLDDTNNFTCIDSDGQLSGMSNFVDLEILWRKCVGKTFFSISLLLLCGTIVGFLFVFFVWKNKTFIMSKLLQILTGHELKKREDYPIGVFIGYAESDHNFPCHVLRKFIRKELKLTTYVYNRDNIPGCDRASSIVDAINASWRLILVFTGNFLCNDDWAMFTTRTAIYGLSPANPARVVVLVLETLQHRLPQDVLCAVPEENILVLSSWEMNADLCAKLRMRLRE